jgi:hypothetical protein
LELSAEAARIFLHEKMAIPSMVDFPSREDLSTNPRALKPTVCIYMCGRYKFI